MSEDPKASSNYGPYGPPPNDPYGTIPIGPYSAPPSDPYSAPPNSPYIAPPNSHYGPPPNGSYSAPPSDPYSNPANGSYSAPNGSYSTPPNYPGDAPTQPSSTRESQPLPLGEAIRQLPNQYIRVLTNPKAAVFAYEQGKAAWDIIWVQIMLSSVVAALVGLMKFNAMILNWMVHGHVSSGTLQLFKAFSSVFALGYIILAPIFFFIVVGFYHLLAKAFGGKGTFLAYSYCTLLYTVPIGIISGLLSIASSQLDLLSPLTSFVTSALGIYSIILPICMTMGVHRLSAARATLAVLVIPIALIVLCVVLVIVGLIFLFSSHAH